MSRTPPAEPRVILDFEAFEERAALAEYDGGLTRLQAESLASTE